MAYALLTHTAAGGTANTVTTSSIDTSGANLIVIVGVYDDGVTPTLSDNKSNTWTGLTLTDGTFNIIRIWYAYAPTVGSGHTFTLAATSAFPSLGVSSYSGAASSPFDAENGNTTGANTTINSGTINPAEDNELHVAGCGIDAVKSITVAGGFTELGEVEFLSSNHYGLSHAYLIQGAAAGASCSFSWTGSISATARGAAFKAAAAAATLRSLLLLGVGT